MDLEPLIGYVADRLPELWIRTGEHLVLTCFSTIAAVCVGVPVGILLFRNGWVRNPAMGFIGILQTIPSLAMLVFLLVMLEKIGVIPALIALTLYALLPIVRNTLTGLEEVPSDVMEAARGIGMTEFQQLLIVRIPFARPFVMAGIKTAAVVGVGIATLSAFIGAGGLGQFINRGLALSNTKLILLGAVPAALLALIVDFSVGAFEWALGPERKRDRKRPAVRLKRTAAFLLPAFLVFAGVLSYFTRPSMGNGKWVYMGGEQKVIKIGSKNFTEQLVLGEIMARLIEALTDLSVERRFNLGGTMICHSALVNGEIDLYGEYTGTALTAILKRKPVSDPGTAFSLVQNAYRKSYGLQWLKPFGFNNTYAITVRKDFAEKRGWTKISDILEEAPSLRAGFTAEFVERADGYPGLRQVYGLSFKDVLDLDPSLMYQAVLKGEVDVICAFATDGRIAEFNLMPLEDDLGFFPPYQAGPVIRKEILDNYPELSAVLSVLEGKIDDATMQRLNFEVDGEKKSPGEVAETFLKSRDLI